MTERKIRVGILFGGKSAEHEVSLQSAKNVVDAIDVDCFVKKSGELISRLIELAMERFELEARLRTAH